MSIFIDDELCTGCGNCVDNCPFVGIEIFDGKAILTEECTFCGACLDVCPVNAILIEREEFQIQKIDLSQYRGVWVIAEHYKNKVHPVVFQLLGKGGELARELEVKLTLVILGDNFEGQLEELNLYGPDEILYLKSPLLKHYYSDLYAQVLTELIIENKPEIILTGATPTGRDFAPRIAKRLNAGLTADCTGLEIDQNTRNLLQTRPTFGGSLMAIIKTPNSRPQMATVRPGIFKVVERHNKKAHVRKIEYKLKERDLVTKIVRVIEKERSSVNLEDAEIIVAGGRGVGSRDKFKIIEELAEVLDAELGGSRVTVELNWLEQDRQIGQTGKTVSPKLYIACGISGAIQHLVGMQNSEIIVAINKDRNAPIFKVAHYSIIGDLHEIVPTLIEEIRKIKSGNS
ncbi:MAG: electron transfer flavoprotein subunit alpha [Candidatus Lokiarchaeota archaeon]|nr:electron transfer flavoprotein subunit alpha [Candidatus Lokiarchaeota archaeon]